MTLHASGPAEDRIRALVREQRQGRLNSEAAVALASDLVSLGVDAPEVVAVASLPSFGITRSDAEPLIRAMIRAFGYSPLEEGEPPDPQVSRNDVEVRLLALIEGAVTRETVSRWALQYVTDDGGSRGVEGPVWKALMALVGADARTTDRPYLYDEQDFRAWLDELRDDADS